MFPSEDASELEGFGSLDETMGACELQAARIDGQDALELTRFAEKKAWIDDKTQFLSSLDPVDASVLEPPSEDQLELWWQEHDAVEAEINAYEMGDLARLKTFAKDASKQTLSERDAELIEITLVTLLALDKLLHLLRDRRRCLKLMEYRLRWEEQVAAAWKEHKSISVAVSAFVERSYLMDPVSSLSTPDSPTRSTTADAEHLTEGRAVQRRHITSSAEALTTDTAQAAASTLDRLIDLSPLPLPDRFLDEQDRLEEAAKATSSGLDNFLDAVDTQRAEVHALNDTLKDLETRAAENDQDLARGAFDDSTQSSALVTRSDQLHEALTTARERLFTLTSQPPLRHATAPQQEVLHRQALARLDDAAAKVERRVQVATDQLQVYQTLAAIVTSASEHRQQIAQLATDLESAAKGLNSLGDRPDADGTEFVAFISACDSYTPRAEPLVVKAKSDLDRAIPLVREASAVVVQCSKHREAHKARAELKTGLERLSIITQRVKERLLQEQQLARAISAARAWDIALETCRADVGTASTLLRTKAQRVRWTPDAIEQSPGIRDDGRHNPVDTIRQVEVALRQSEQDASAYLSRRQRPHASLSNRAEQLHSRVATLRYSSMVVSNLETQRDALVAVLTVLATLDDDMTQETARATALLEGPAADLTEDSHSRALERLTALQDAYQVLLSSAHQRVPFVHSATKDATALEALRIVDVDLEAQDGLVRSTVNDRIARASARLDNLQRISIQLTSRQRLVAWEHDYDGFLESLRAAEVDKEADTSAHIASLASRLESLRVELLTLDQNSGRESLNERTSSLRSAATRLAALKHVEPHTPHTATNNDASLATPPVSQAILPQHATSLNVQNSGSPPIGDHSQHAESPTGDELECGVRRPTSELATLRTASATTSPQALEDVFGIPTLPLFGVEAETSTRRSDTPDLATWLDADRCRQLPDMKTAMSFQIAANSCNNGQPSRAANQDRLGIARASQDDMKRVIALATCSGDFKVADDALSALLDAIDDEPPSPSSTASTPVANPPRRSVLAQCLLSAAEKITIARKRAVPAIHDSRVISSIKRLEASYAEMLAMAEDIDRRVPSMSRSSSRSSLIGRPRTSAIDDKRSLCEISGNLFKSSARPSISRTGTTSSASRSSRKLQEIPRPASAAPRPFARNEEQETPRRRPSSAAAATPRSNATVPRAFNFSTALKKDSTRRAPPPPLTVCEERLTATRATSGRGDEHTSSRRRSSMMSSLSSSLSSSVRSSRRSSNVSTPSLTADVFDSTPLRRQAYKADPNRRVDVQIGKIVNGLDVHVPIAPAEGAWNDESGMYWIGDAKAGRLYYLRILRSIVMLRTGGGWVDLSQFLLSHFNASSNITVSPRISPTSSRQVQEPHWLKSPSLAASRSKFGASRSELSALLSSSTSALHLVPSSPAPGRRTVSDGNKSKPQRSPFVATSKSYAKTPRKAETHASQRPT